MKIRTAPALFAALLITLLVGQVSAQTLLAPATAATTITLDAQASVDVENDRMQVTLGTSEDGEDTRVLTQRVLARLNQALAQVQRAGNAEARLSGVTTQPIYDAKGKTARWTVSGSITLQSRNFTEMGALASELSRELRIQSVDFSLSTAAQDKARDQLIAELAQSVDKKARATTAAFGFTQYRIQTLALDQSQVMPRAVRNFAMAKGADMASASVPLPAEGGTSTVTLHVTATLLAEGKTPVKVR